MKNNKDLYELDLSYFRKGDDLKYAMSKTKTDADAFIYQAKELEYAAQTLRRMASYAIDGLVSIANIDSYRIELSVDKNLGDALVDEGVFYNTKFEDGEITLDLSYPEEE